MRAFLWLLVAAVAALGQPAANFPGATVTWQDILIAKGPATATLAANLTDSATTISVTDGTQYAGFSAVQIESEVILICTIDGNTLNVCPGGRGFSGTAAAAHIPGRSVRNTITTHHHNQIAAEMKAVQEALGVNLGNVAAAGHMHLAATLPATLVYNTDVYADPVWITSLAKSKVGLGSVENAALSTWAGSANITILGTISSGTVPWARLSNVPTSFVPSIHSHAIGDLSTVGDWSSKITSGTYSISVTGSAGAVAWSGVSSKPLGIVDLPISQAIAADNTSGNGMALIQRRKGGGTPAPFWVEGVFRVGDLLHWSFRPPSDYASGGGVTIFYKMTSAASGNVQFSARLSCYANGYGASLADKGFGANNASGNLVVPAAAGRPSSASWALGNLDGLTASHFCHVGLMREAASSEATGTAEVVGVQFYYNR